MRIENRRSHTVDPLESLSYEGVAPPATKTLPLPF